MLVLPVPKSSLSHRSLCYDWGYVDLIFEGAASTSAVDENLSRRASANCPVVDIDCGFVVQFLGRDDHGAPVGIAPVYSDRRGMIMVPPRPGKPEPDPRLIKVNFVRNHVSRMNTNLAPVPRY